MEFDGEYALPGCTNMEQLILFLAALEGWNVLVGIKGMVV